MKDSSISAPASVKKCLPMALVVVILVLFSTTALPAGGASPAVKAPVAAAAPVPTQQSAWHSEARIWLGEPRSIAPNYVRDTGVVSPSPSVGGRPSQDRGARQHAATTARIRSFGDVIVAYPSIAEVGPPSQDGGAPRHAATAAQILSSGQASALSLVSADFNGDGLADLAAGYAAPGGGGIIAVHYGSLDALAPQSDTTFQAIGRGEFPAPFLPNARVFSVPVAPDLLAVGNFTGHGTNDLVVAARGATVMYVLPGDGKGNFRAPQVVYLSGGVTTLGGGKLGRTSLSSDLLVGVSGPEGPSLLVYRGASNGLKLLARYSLGGPVSAIAFGNLTGGAGADAAVVANGELVILSSASMQLRQVALPISATTVALGSFVYDREGRTQMAIVSPDGSVHIVVRSGIDSRPLTPAERKAVFLAAARGLANPVVPSPNPNEDWKVLESFGLAGSGPLPVLLRTRVSSNAADDVMVLNGSTRQMVVISHPNLPQGASTFVPGLVATRPYTGSPVAAVSMHINIDGRPGIVALHQGESAPSVMMPLPDPVFNVNTTNDVVVANACANNVANSCSLREAIIEANADNLNDTINVPAGTYTLTLTGANKEIAGATAAYGSLDIFHGVTINGAVDGGGNPTTIVQAGTNNTNGIDKVFAVNPNADPGFDTHFSNLVIRFGKNPGSFIGVASVIPHGFGGGLFWEGAQTGNMSVVNCIITDNSTVDGDGGGIAADNAGAGSIGTGTGTFTLTNSIVQNNSAQESSTGNPGVGGGIFVFGGTPMVISGTQVLNNQASQTAGSVGGQGGGILLRPPSNNTTQSAIHGSVISGNNAAGHGGGISTGQGLLVDNTGAAMAISGNQGDQGGGLWSDLNTDTTTVSKATITGNTATGVDGTNCVDSCGGGIFAASSGAVSSHLVINFSRLAGNTAASGNNLTNLGTAASTDDATNNWWGTNSPATTIHDANAAVTFDPFVVLTHTANPASIGINGSSTLTATLNSDNHGETAVLSFNLDVFNGLPIDFNNPVLGTILEAQPEALSSTAVATATYNAGNIGGAGSADATVDQQTVTASIAVSSAAFPPTISKVFLPDTVTQNGQVLLSFTITNPNSDPNPNLTLTGIQFTDALPAGLEVASPNQLSNSCGGTVTATPGSSSISLSGGSLGPAVQLRPQPKSFVRLAQPAASGSCFISVEVKATSVGVLSNTTGPISANESGPGAVSNTASLTVITAPIVVPPTVSKAFGAASIPLNGTTSLSFTITNPNSTIQLVNTGLADILPGGLVVATPNGLAGSCVADGGVVTADPGTTSIALSTLNLPGGSACSFSLNVTGTSSGVKNNVSGNVTGTFDDGTGGFKTITGGTASASIVVLVPPSITKVFNPGTIAPTGVSVLSFTITNPSVNPVSLTGVGFTDTLPANLFVATPNGATGSCGGGTLMAVAGSSTISLTGGTIVSGGSCTVSANVTSAVVGAYNNNTTVTSDNAGVGNTASATLIVALPNLSITKTHEEEEFERGAKGATYTITVSNSAGAGPTLGTVTVIDTLPAVQHTFVPTAIGGTGWTCNLGTLTCTRSDSLAPGASYPPITLTVNVTKNIREHVTNSATVSGGSDPNSHTANDLTHILPADEDEDDGDHHDDGDDHGDGHRDDHRRGGRDDH
ncbi:MAG TPA: hypothetical protein VN176_04775 [Verrucomicrobiae bacterium]|jgi:uncharacterized repeat protein (TIGR01451 family)|nr:hypothetical protein [Verrucomicrobiae bacterium]